MKLPTIGNLPKLSCSLTFILSPPSTVPRASRRWITSYTRLQSWAHGTSDGVFQLTGSFVRRQPNISSSFTWTIVFLTLPSNPKAALSSEHDRTPYICGHPRIYQLKLSSTLPLFELAVLHVVVYYPGKMSQR